MFGFEACSTSLSWYIDSLAIQDVTDCDARCERCLGLRLAVHLCCGRLTESCYLRCSGLWCALQEHCNRLWCALWRALRETVMRTARGVAHCNARCERCSGLWCALRETVMRTVMRNYERLWCALWCALREVFRHCNWDLPVFQVQMVTASGNPDLNVNPGSNGTQFRMVTQVQMVTAIGNSMYNSLKFPVMCRQCTGRYN